jgi:hypothetical protein
METEIADTKKGPCPCCDAPMMFGGEEDDWNICPVCCWENDPVQRENPDYEGGANYMSLHQARNLWQATKKPLC